ncbi:MAG TPA: discoidin domain-containing protein [Polyangiaceae bacterium]|nr:discoidin domain-containing protein [Polyangiaceae bacterium]
MKTHSMNGVGDGGRAGHVLRVGTLLAALSAAGCSGGLEDGVAEDGETDSIEQALDLPMCTPSCPIPNVLRQFGAACNCLPGLMDTSFQVNFARMPGAWAFQSSTDFNGDAFRAIDDIKDGNYWNWGVTHTNNTQVSSNAPGSTTNQQWLEVRLGAARRVRHVRIYNRTDCCAERLGRFSIWGINANNGMWARIGGADMNGNTTRIIDIDVDDLTTWLIVVQKDDSEYLSLAEVQVWGYLEL